MDLLIQEVKDSGFHIKIQNSKHGKDLGFLKGTYYTFGLVYIPSSLTEVWIWANIGKQLISRLELWDLPTEPYPAQETWVDFAMNLQDICHCQFSFPCTSWKFRWGHNVIFFFHCALIIRQKYKYGDNKELYNNVRGEVISWTTSRNV